MTRYPTQRPPKVIPLVQSSPLKLFRSTFRPHHHSPDLSVTIFSYFLPLLHIPFTPAKLPNLLSPSLPHYPCPESSIQSPTHRPIKPIRPVRRDIVAVHEALKDLAKRGPRVDATRTRGEGELAVEPAMAGVGNG